MRTPLSSPAVLAGVLAAAGALSCGGPSTPAPANEFAAEPAAAEPVDLLVVAKARQIWLSPNLEKGDQAIGTSEDPGDPAVMALAIRGGVVVATGSCQELRARHFSPGTPVLTLATDDVAVPGLVDAHAHLYGLGRTLESLDLRGSRSPAEVAGRVARAAGELPEGSWITGRGWDQSLWTPAEFPTAAELGDIDNPVAIRRVDGHALWANAAAMKRAGITADTRDPEGGRILRAESGEPTGIFIDNAIELVEKAIPEADAATRERQIRRAAAHVVALGLTGVHEMGMSEKTAAVYRKLAKDGELDVRVYGFRGYRDGLENELPALERAPGSPAMFRIGGVKIYADGALGSRGASLLAPYSDAPDSSGLTITSGAKLARIGAVLVKKGYQIAVHAIGDKANRETLDAYAEILEKLPGDRRLRIEHAQVVSDADIPRFSKLGIIASMQPTHATSDMRWAEKRLGPERVHGSYAWRRLLEADAQMVFGSDFPVEKPAPLLGIYAAVTRQDESGKPPGGWRSDQRVTLHEALAFFTLGPALASFGEEHRLGLTPGMVADISVFDGPLRADSSLLTRKAVATVVDGRPVYTDEAHRVSKPQTLSCE